MAQASRTAKPAFYDAVHQAVEKYSGLTFSRPPLDQANASFPVKKLRSITNSLGMQFREIAAGSFVHVDERQGKTTARVTQPFYLGVFEVTQSQFKSVMGFNPSGLGTRSIYDKTVELPLHNDNLPVNNITALEGIKFCWKLSQVDAERKCKRSYRLPTEHEWELACRAGTTTRFHFGGTGDYTPKLANFAPRHFRYGHEFPTTAPQAIGSYPPNAFGIYDMHGNVCEPCMDARGKWEASMPDFVRINDAPGSHVYRGADYLSMPQDTGSSYRHHFYTGVPFAQAGLRVVCVIEPASKLSRKILETQHSWCDPTLQELRFAKRAITKATEAINKGDTSAYLDRVAAYARHAKHSKDPMRDFKLAKADLLASKAHLDARYKRVEYGEVGRDLAVAVAERCEQMGEAKAARAWWQTALRFANLATDETRKMAAEHNDAKQRKYKFQRAADQLRQATEIMEELGLVDEAIARLDEEIKRLPDFMPLRERRAEVMQTDPNAT